MSLDEAIARAAAEIARHAAAQREYIEDTLRVELSLTQSWRGAGASGDYSAMYHVQTLTSGEAWILHNVGLGGVWLRRLDTPRAHADLRLRLDLEVWCEGVLLVRRPFAPLLEEAPVPFVRDVHLPGGSRVEIVVGEPSDNHRLRATAPGNLALVFHGLHRRSVRDEAQR